MLQVPHRILGQDMADNLLRAVFGLRNQNASQVLAVMAAQSAPIVTHPSRSNAAPQNPEPESPHRKPDLRQRGTLHVETEKRKQRAERVKAWRGKCSMFQGGGGGLEGALWLVEGAADSEALFHLDSLCYSLFRAVLACSFLRRGKALSYRHDDGAEGGAVMMTKMMAITARKGINITVSCGC